MRANYGYADGTGEFYLTIDTDKCNGCGDCVEACPQGIFELSLDDTNVNFGQLQELITLRMLI